MLKRTAKKKRPRLGFVGLGWIGAMRLEAVAGDGGAEIAALCDASPGRLESTARSHSPVACFQEYDELLSQAADLRLDGVVIATPNALHFPQTLAALDRGLAVFCQKPLGLDAGQTRFMVDAARQAGRRLGVDYSYRFTEGAQRLRELIAGGALGRVFFLETVFHNAYGPDKPWCFDPALSGGGALMDLGVHLIDLAFWLLGDPGVRGVQGAAFRGGAAQRGVTVDDFATARLELEGGAVATLAVSWSAHAGQDCVIRSTAFGTAGGADFRNVAGSFYDFELARFDGRTTAIETRESRDWMGKAILHWVDRLAEGPGFDPEVERSVAVSAVVDAVYGYPSRMKRYS
jgi:predicted dehydrogenase